MDADAAATRKIALCLVAGVLCAVLMGTGLSILSKPTDFDTRMEVVEARTREAELLAKTATSSDRQFAAGAVCPELSDQQLELFKQSLSDMAAQTGVAITGVTLLPAEPTGGREPLTPVTFSVDASGAYQAVLQFLDLTAKSRPNIFVDGLDLGSQNFVVTLSMTGKVYCWTGR